MIKVEWDHDFMDGSFHAFQVFESWEEAFVLVKKLSQESPYETFAISEVL